MIIYSVNMQMMKFCIQILGHTIKCNGGTQSKQAAQQNTPSEISSSSYFFVLWNISVRWMSIITVKIQNILDLKSVIVVANIRNVWMRRKCCCFALNTAKLENTQQMYWKEEEKKKWMEWNECNKEIGKLRAI